MLAQFGGTPHEAVAGYEHFVQEGEGRTGLWDASRHQSILGNDAFVACFEDPKRLEQLSDIPKSQRRPPAAYLEQYRERYPRNEAIPRAYLLGA